MHGNAKGLLTVMMEVEPEADAEFNHWMDDEHIPERLAIPGFVAATRFRMADNPHKYLQLYEIADAAVLDRRPIATSCTTIPRRSR